MDNNEKCEIVRDLATQYIEKSINEGSEKFIRNHLQECEDCKKYYNTLEAKIGNEDEQEVFEPDSGPGPVRVPDRLRQLRHHRDHR